MGSGASKDKSAPATSKQNGSAPTANGGAGGKAAPASNAGGDGAAPGGDEERPQTAAQQEQAKKSPMTKQLERYKYEPPAPPKTKKAEIFDPEKFKHVDEYPATMPKNIMYGTFKEVGKWLTEKFKTDIEKLRSLFMWASSIDVGSLQQTLEELPAEGTPLDYLLRIHWQMGNHAHFFSQLCRSGGIPCIIVTGMNKSAAYQLGGPVDKRSMAAQWNAAYIDGQWRILDIFWASTCVVGKKTGEWSLLDVDGDLTDEDEEEDDGETKHQINEAYFIPDPECIITTHYPDEPAWQLLEEPLTVEDFEKRVYIRERFFDMGLSLCDRSEPHVVVEPKKGEVDLFFALDSSRDPVPLQFRYLMFRQKKPGDKVPNITLERFILFQKKVDVIQYWCQFPFTGRYKMDVFGQMDGNHDTFDLCCSYLFDVTVAKKDAKPLPDIPDIGWGPGADAKACGLIPLTHTEPFIETDDGKVQMKFRMEKPLDIVQNLKSEEMEEWLLKRNAAMTIDGDELTIDIRLPTKGEYAFNLFAAPKGHKGELPNVCNYLIRCKKDNPNLKPFPKYHEGVLGASPNAATEGISATSHPGDSIKTDTGKFSVDFAHGGNHDILVEVDNHDMDRKALANCVNVKNNGKSSTIDVALPAAGDYAMNVYGSKKGSDQVFHVHTYQVTSTQSDKTQIAQSKGDVPVAPYATSSETATLQIPRRENPVTCELQKRNVQEAIAHDRVKVKKTDDEDVMSTKLPDEHEYRQDVFERKPSGALQALCTYQLVRHEPMPDKAGAKKKAAAAAEDEEKPATPDDQLSEEERERRRIAAAKEAQHRAFRESLKAAMASQDPALLRKAIADFEKNKVADPKHMLDKAKKMLRFLTVSQEMKDSMSKRDLQRLEKAVSAAEKEGFDKKLGLQFQMAKKVLEQLRRIEKLRHAILDLDQKTIAELKSYSSPPDGVYEVMAATFLLLGNSEKELKDWPQVVVWMGKTGKESLKRRITLFEVSSLKIATSQKAKNKVKRFELDFIRDVSSGAATFYVWVMGMIEECESQFQQNGGDLNMLRPATSKSRKGKK